MSEPRSRSGRGIAVAVTIAGGLLLAGLTAPVAARGPGHAGSDEEVSASGTST